MDTLRQFNDNERASLYQIVSHEGFQILNEIIKIEVEKFREELLNADPSDKEKILALHHLAKAASMVYVALANRINMECDFYLKRPKVTDEPVDMTEGILDIDDINDGNLKKLREEL